MKIDFDQVKTEVSEIAKKSGCNDVQASNISGSVYHWLKAREAGVSHKDYAQLKSWYSDGMTGVEMVDRLSIPIHKVYKVIKPQPWP